jgi:hypothetical protein
MRAQCFFSTVFLNSALMRLFLAQSLSAFACPCLIGPILALAAHEVPHMCDVQDKVQQNCNPVWKTQKEGHKKQLQTLESVRITKSKSQLKTGLPQS